MNRLTRWTGCAVLCMLVAVSARGQTNTEHATPLRVMSFNVRYGTAPDSENRWEKRRDLLVETIRRFDPDLLGTQETLFFQAEFLSTQLPAYTRVGVGRDDGHTKGEQVTIFFKTDRFEELATGHFWLSERPEQPGSRSWDAAITRMVTWAKLRDRKRDQVFLWLNTHWDHVGAQARVESAKLMRSWLADQAPEAPVIITGDFNSVEDSPQYRYLLGADGDKLKLIDTYRRLHPVRQPDEASFHDFTGKREGSRIDWILCSPPFGPVEATIDHFNQGGRYPSDHFSVTAVLQ
ncbi:MAG TPA: endonuclease/exonuclease/phosphatase family protein [Verrucomicrobiae bacterium]|nr:endonuclease/exonuclease/phosphatase family protein [Verrucomicrobiae bacterium]